MRRMLEAEGEPDPQGQPWDWPYLNERQRRALGLDAADLSAHFALGTVLQGLFDLVREVFGVVVTERSDPRGWHPDVRAFDLTDRDTGDRLAHLYLDPFARDGKRPGAWMTTLAEGPTVPGQRRERPTITFVSNVVQPPAGVEPLLHHNDVITLFHEFGHVLEFGLSDPEVFPAQFTWVELDFVEAPSQIMEHWVWQPEVLRRLARHHVSGEPPPDALLERLAASRRLNPGISTLWVLGYRSILDQRLHGPDAVDPETAYREAFTVTRLPFPEGTFQPASFSHTMADYDAGFYGYLWAQVFGDDMFGAFLRNGPMSPDLGVRYRREVLEPTWTRTGTDRVRGFLGRESSNRAFLERLGIID
jgi:Zn-dependent oligopeptidase